MMRQNVSTGDIPFRKTYIRLVVDRIKVDDGIVRVIGDKSTLERSVTGRPVFAVLHAIGAP